MMIHGCRQLFVLYHICHYQQLANYIPKIDGRRALETGNKLGITVIGDEEEVIEEMIQLEKHAGVYQFRFVKHQMKVAGLMFIRYIEEDLELIQCLASAMSMKYANLLESDIVKCYPFLWSLAVQKNLRVCRSCHDFAKAISKIV
ncbi:hypothetical protein V6N13_117086 [Hibiscus sabdariffa]|uniref:DYW domain-containing protein n=1 Tax=Hibiscus sabdariffa TaxID=183260 RepID=A0ABR2QHC4_9ROSI